MNVQAGRIIAFLAAGVPIHDSANGQAAKRFWKKLAIQRALSPNKVTLAVALPPHNQAAGATVAEPRRPGHSNRDSPARAHKGSTQFKEPTFIRAAHFAKVGTGNDLSRSNCGFQASQVFHLPGRLAAPVLQNTLPIFLTGAYWGTGLRLRPGQGGFHGRIQLLWPGCQTTRLHGRGQSGLRTLQIWPQKPCFCFGLYSLSNGLSMRPPAQPRLGVTKGKVVWQDIHSFRQPSPRHLPDVLRQASIARQC